MRRQVSKNEAMGFDITGDPAADRVLDESAFALLVGMMLDQQYPMEHAFRGPSKLLDRLGSLDPAAVAAADPEELAELCARTPAIHRFPGSMAARLQELARVVEQEYDGDAAAIWTGASTGRELLRRVQALPGFGAQKAKIFVALLAKQLDVRPDGWEAAVGDYALDGYRSVADVTGSESLQKVREHKKEQKAAAKAAKAGGT
ncbi:hypothetical protein ENKNEFLB_03123 [Nocardioides aquaticus]|uniref:HhH-GPD domain-containing protein n=2 Tax=Nocardioides aquaticus TaxID=160826 RepID=A0ABX8ENP9_9ACTN|nr:hypothetical protein ENKNEFLB_03123 [Nocardioides aquaticus]